MLRYWIFFFCCVSLQATAQDSKKNYGKAKSAFDNATLFLSKGQYHMAIENLKQSISYDRDFAEAHQQLADIYRKEEDYQAASLHYAEVIRINPNLTPYSHYGYGESLFSTGLYAEALQQFNLFVKKTNITPQSRNKAEKYIQDCLFSIDNKKKPLLITLEDLGPAINTVADEYFPMLTADETGIIFTRKENNQENFFESIYSDTGGWEPAVPLAETINTKNFNEGAHTLSADGNYLFFTGCNRPDGLGSCDIYVSKREGEGWSTPFRLPEPVNSTSWDAQPALSADGKTIYFVSNRKGGFGGADIWKSTVADNGEWGPAENLGPTINTAYNESSPSIHADNETLYFASEGWPGYGKSDLFFSKKDDKSNWALPVNLGYPINDFAEQRSISVNFNGDVAYVATQSTSGNKDLDIFRFTLPKPLRPNPVTYIKGIVLDESTKERIPAHVILTRLRDNQNLFDDYADAKDGTFLAPLRFGFQYALQVDHPGYLFYSEHYALEDSSLINNSFDIKIHLKPIVKGKTTTLNNIFFAVDQVEILPQSETDLALLLNFLKNNPTVEIEISGHTDTSGSKEHNQTLSEARAKSVYEYLVKNNIDPARLSYRGYGQEQPIASNDTAEGRSKNRRTEFKIIEVK